MPYDVNTDYKAKSFNHRVRFLVLHYTAGNFQTSLKELTEGPVSAHYLLPDGPMDDQREVFSLVPEAERAWHAGVSAWQDRTDLNDSSIGIEMVNLGYTDKDGKRTWYPFTDYQIETVSELAKDIIARYGIEATRVVGHGDIAPGRKVDPGPVFPWKQLYERGIGAWYEEADQQTAEQAIHTTQASMIVWMQTYLRIYGYPVKKTGQLDLLTKQVIAAFQMHFRASHYSGIPDKETCAILYALVKKYYPRVDLHLPGILTTETCSK